ncbi:hypothetical protein BCR44DRAFT_1425277, partial [Catenaria anguillulae PL171]
AIPPFGFHPDPAAAAESSSLDSNANADPTATSRPAPAPGPFGPLPRPPTSATPSRPRPNPFNQPCTPIIHGGINPARKRALGDDDDDDMDCDDDETDGPSPTPRKRRLTSRLALSRRVVVGHLLTATPGGSVPMDVDSPVARTPAKTPSFSFPSKYAWNLSPTSPSAMTPLRASASANIRQALAPLPCKPSPFFKSHMYKPSPDKMVVIEEVDVEDPSLAAAPQPEAPVHVGLQTPRRWMPAKGTPGSRPRFMRVAEERGEEVPGKRRLFANVAGSSTSASSSQAYEHHSHHHPHHHQHPPVPSSPLATSAPLTSAAASSSSASTTAALRAITSLPRPATHAGGSTPSKPQSGSRMGITSGTASPLAPVPEDHHLAISKPARTRLDFAAMASGARTARAQVTADARAANVARGREQQPNKVPQSPYLFRGTPQRVREGKSKWVFGK